MPKRKYPLNTILHTKDGRKIGNAIVIGHRKANSIVVGANIIKTDYGNLVTLVDSEVSDLFYVAYDNLSGAEREYARLSATDHKHYVHEQEESND